jgi:hypothetical protein
MHAPTEVNQESAMYTPQFFAFQIAFAQHVATRFGLPFSEALFSYTTLTRTLDIADWGSFAAQLSLAEHMEEWVYRWYLDHQTLNLRPEDTSFLGYPLFGCFYYAVRNETIIRPHFIKNDRLGPHVLRQDRLVVRQQELRQMFAHIHTHVPAAETVLGNSWMYNLPAYRRIFPPAYTADCPMSDEAEFQFLAFWGQCFGADWNPKPNIAAGILERLSQITHLDDLRWCFPYQILQPSCPISVFFRYYELSQ